MEFDQAEFDVRCEWGERGVAHLAPISDAVIIVDVMSFSTCVSVAAARGTIVYPCPLMDDAAIEFARSVGGELATARGKGRYSLSPRSLVDLPVGTRLVLPSPNGSTLSLATGQTPTFAGCLRNSRAVAEAAQKRGRRIAVIPAGEKWKEDASLRPAIEDLIGAGAIIRHLMGRHSPEAELATSAFLSAAPELNNKLQACSSGQELVAMGFEIDIALIAALDADDCAPILRDGAYSKAEQM